MRNPPVIIEVDRIRDEKLLEQVTNGVAVRMAVLYLLAGAGKQESGAKRSQQRGSSPTVREGAQNGKSGVKEKRGRVGK